MWEADGSGEWAEVDVEGGDREEEEGVERQDDDDGEDLLVVLLLRALAALQKDHTITKLNLRLNRL